MGHAHRHLAQRGVEEIGSWDRFHLGFLQLRNESGHLLELFFIVFSGENFGQTLWLFDPLPEVPLVNGLDLIELVRSHVLLQQLEVFVAVLCVVIQIFIFFGFHNRVDIEIWMAAVLN